MGIDWLTVAAQIVNFLVLAWLLKRFLYRPVIDAMRKREAGIASRLAQAEQRELEAQDAAAAYREKAAAVDRERQAQLGRAREAAECERRALLEQARAEARADRERWQQDLQREQADFDATLMRELAESAVDVARRTLDDLADARLEAQALAVLARQLHALPDDERQAFADAAPHLRLATRFEPDAKALAALREALAGTLGKAVQLECLRKPELVFGLELAAGGHKLAWNAAAYLDEIAARVRTGIDDARQATNEPVHEPVNEPVDEPGRAGDAPAQRAGAGAAR